MRLGRKTKRLLPALAVSAAVLALPYLRAEILTARYGEAFADTYRQSGMIDEIACFKVTAYSEQSAAVFYVTKGHGAGARMELARDRREAGPAHV